MNRVNKQQRGVVIEYENNLIRVRARKMMKCNMNSSSCGRIIMLRVVTDQYDNNSFSAVQNAIKAVDVHCIHLY